MQSRPPLAAQEQSPSAIRSLAWLDRYLAMPWIFALLAAAIFFSAWNRGIILLYALFAMLVSLALYSFIGSRCMLRGATVEVDFPRQSSVGDSIEVSMRIAAHRWPYRRRMLQLKSPFPFAPDQSVFLANAGNGLQHRQHVVCSRRGYFVLTAVRVSCAYPVGLLHWQVTWTSQPVGITVYPRVHPISSFSLSAASQSNLAEERHSSSLNGQEIFREVREYRNGDNPRHIHWRSSARAGRRLVKQFDSVSNREAWLVLDQDESHHAGEGEHHSFERAVEIAASLASYFSKAGIRYGLAGGMKRDGNVDIVIMPGTGASHLNRVMETLATMQVNPYSDYAAVLGALEPHYRPGQQWILFRHGERLALPRFLRG